MCSRCHRGRIISLLLIQEVIPEGEDGMVEEGEEDRDGADITRLLVLY